MGQIRALASPLEPALLSTRTEKRSYVIRTLSSILSWPSQLIVRLLSTEMPLRLCKV